MAYYEGQISDIGGNNNGFGNGWEGLIGLALVAGLFDGGFGFGGNRGGYGYAPAPATQADLSAGFANSEIMSDLNDIILGQAQMQNFINQGFAGINASLATGFAGVNSGMSTLGFQTQAGFNALGTQLAQCCCDTRSAIADLKYSNERQTCDIIRASADNTKAILDYLTTEKISALQAENSGLKAQISNDKQSAYLISQLREPCPIPSYQVPNPHCCYNPYNFNCASVQ